MPYFRIMLEGKGIDVPADDNGHSIAGFFTTRLVKAATGEESEEKAKNLILSEWSSGPYAKANKGSLPVLTVSSITKNSFIESLKFKNEGYSFYLHDDEEHTDKDE